MKIIGLMLTWNNLEFFKQSVHQALGFCDELIVVEGCHSQQYPKHSTDGTCEYLESIKNLPKLRVLDFDFKGRYDVVQSMIRLEFPKTSKFYKGDSWIFYWDDDVFFMEKDLPRIKKVMELTTRDSIGCAYRNFIYNFRFNLINKKGINIYRLVDGLRIFGISTSCYRDGNRFSLQDTDVMAFHYTYVKKPERLNARMVMSIEKGTKASVRRYEQWMSVEWEKDEDIFKSRAILESIRPNEELNIYRGEHPQAVADHPWRHIDDVRKI